MIRTQRAHLHVAALSHPGLSGKNNEDRFTVLSHVLSKEDRTASLFALLCDGIGGHRAGEVAAEMAVEQIAKAVAQSNGREPLTILEEAIHSASAAIGHHSSTSEERAGMGSTCACAWVIGEKLYVAYVGDSRIYLLRDNKIQQLTHDHTWVQEAVEKKIITAEEAQNHPNVHVIRRYLGSLKLPEVDFRLMLRDSNNSLQATKNQGTTLLPQDILLLCTDGLTDLVWADEIQKIILAGNNLKTVAQNLVAKANERGGHDNITVILMAVPKPRAQGEKKKGIIEWLKDELVG